MTIESDLASHRLARLILWTLRLTVVVQCVGNWLWLTQIEETPLLHWMLDPRDIGGLAGRESTALAVQQMVGWMVLLAAGSVLWRPHVVVLSLLVLLQTSITVAMWRIADGYALQASWAPPQLLALFPFATHLLRIAAPLGLLLLCRLSLESPLQGSPLQRTRMPGPGLQVRPSDRRRFEFTMQLMRWAVAIVFLAHGVEGWQHNPKFVDLLINASQALFGTSLAQSTAERLLTVIGGVDIVFAAACVSRRWRFVLWWMTFWGGATALGRLVANGWDMSGHEALTRISHFGVPLAVVLWWHLLKCDKTKNLAVKNERSTPPGISKVPQSSRSSTPLLWFFVLIATAIGSGQGSRAKADAVLAGVHPAQWRLVWTSDPATSAVLCWNTLLPGQQHRVHLHRADGDEAAVAAQSQQENTSAEQLGAATVIEAQRNGRYSATSPELYFHHVQLSDLEPATKYRVVLESDGQRSPAMFFVTAPSEDVPVSFLFGADSRSGQQARRQINAMMAKMLAESYAAQRVPILALAHGGDFIRDGRELDQWSRWMSDHELTVTTAGQLLPIIPARGNHDGGELFNEVFAFPADDANYYSLDLGPQVRLITLNTETSMSGDQRNWLQAELAAARPQRRWLLAQYHRPAFPAVKLPSLSLVNWVPLFEKFNVDLVCEGDGHNIKRTAPIRNFHIDPTGVVYIGEGGLGVGQRAPKPGRWYLNSSQAKIGEGHHVQLLTCDETQLSYRVVLLGGEVFDEHFLPVRAPLPNDNLGESPAGDTVRDTVRDTARDTVRDTE